METKTICLPGTALCRVCRNLMTDFCEECPANRYNRFEPIRMSFVFLPIFTMEDYKKLPNGAKGELLAFYIIQIMKHLQGVDNGNSDDY